MPQPMSIARAAKLAGVKRSELQQQLLENGFDNFEGRVKIGDLLVIYPDLDLNRDPVFERIQHIRKNARPKRDYTDGSTPDPEVLIVRLKEMQSVLARTKTLLNRSEANYARIREGLLNLRQKAEGTFADDIDALIRELDTLKVAEDGILDPKAEIFARDMFYKVLAAKVKLTPSGHEFEVEGRESLLEAALRSGLHLDFGCSSGTCGKCKCRVTHGKVLPLREHDYYLSKQEQERGYVLACSTTAVTDLFIEAREAKVPNDLPQQKIRAAVIAVKPIGEGGILLSVKTPHSKMLRFMSGQQMQLTNEAGDMTTLPIASCACDGRNLEFLVREHRDNFARSLKLDQLVGQALLIEGPFGEFVLREDTHAPLVFVAAADGYGPIMSMLEQALSMDRVHRIQLYLIDEATWGRHYEKRLRAWQDAFDHFELIQLPSTTGVSQLRQSIQQQTPEVGGCEFYLAGPENLVNQLEKILKLDREIEYCKAQVTN